MTGTDLNSRPGSEMGLYRLPSRYQSYTTLPRPEQHPLDVTQLPQNSVYGIPKAVAQHGRTKSTERGSVYGTAEKRPLSQVSGSRSLHTIHTEPYMPRVGSKALSFYGLPYDDESSKGLKTIIPWTTLNAFYVIQVSFFGLRNIIFRVEKFSRNIPFSVLVSSWNFHHCHRRNEIIFTI